MTRHHRSLALNLKRQILLYGTSKNTLNFLKVVSGSCSHALWGKLIKKEDSDANPAQFF